MELRVVGAALLVMAVLGVTGWFLTGDDGQPREATPEPVMDGIVWQYGQAGVGGTEPGFLQDPGAAHMLADGNLLITDSGNRRVIEVDHEGSIVWQYGTTGVTGSGWNELGLPAWDAQRLPSGNTLITDCENNRIIEVTPDRDIVWQFSDVFYPRDAERLWNGNTLIADCDHWRVIEVDLDGNIVWEQGGMFLPTDADRLPNGNTLICEPDRFRVIEVTPANEIVWQYGSTCGYGPGQIGFIWDADRLLNGNTLITDTTYHRVIEVSPEGELVWQYGTGGVSGTGDNLLCYPWDAERLPDGTTIITEKDNCRIIRVASLGPAGSIIWQYGLTHVRGTEPGMLADPGAAHMLESGNLLITDSGNYRVIEVTQAKEIVWQFGTTGVGGTGDGQLGLPAWDAQRLDDGNTLITDCENSRVIEVTPDGDIVWQYGTSRYSGELYYPRDAERLLNGNTLIADTDHWRVIEVDTDKNIVWEQGGMYLPSDADRLANGNTLICEPDRFRVIEVTPANEIVWQYGSACGYGPGQIGFIWDADRLENGNTLITDTTFHRVIEVTPDGDIAWQYGVGGISGEDDGYLNYPWDAERLPDGTTLITEKENCRVIRVGPKAKLDTQPPVITVLSPVDGEEYSSPVQLLYTVVDNFDESPEVTSEYVSGSWFSLFDEYTVTIEARDSSGNVASKTITFSIGADLAVPYFYQQSTRWCTLNSVSMLFAYYGFDIHPWEIAEFYGKSWNDGVNWGPAGTGTNEDPPLEDFISSFGLVVDMYYSDPQGPDLTNLVYWYLAHGYPIMFSYWPKDTSLDPHTIVITGYREHGGEANFIVNDPSYGSWIRTNRDANLLNPSNWNEYYIHAIRATPNPIVATFSMYRVGGMKIQSDWCGTSIVEETVLDAGIQWTWEKLPVLEFKRPFTFGSVVLNTPLLYLSNCLDTEITCRIDVSIGKVESDGSVTYLASLPQFVNIPQKFLMNVQDSFPLDLKSSGLYQLKLTASRLVDGEIVGNIDRIEGIEFIYDQPPVAEACDNLLLLTDEAGVFDGSLSHDDGSITTLTWDFGDGTGTAEGAVVEHVFTGEGTYTVTLRVADDWGIQALDTLQVRVIAPSTAVAELEVRVDAMALDEEVATGLTDKLEAALDAMASPNSEERQDAGHKLESFMRQVEAQRGKSLTEEQADQLVEWAKWVRENL